MRILDAGHGQAVTIGLPHAMPTVESSREQVSEPSADLAVGDPRLVAAAVITK